MLAKTNNVQSNWLCLRENMLETAQRMLINVTDFIISCK
jgi:hypothetical protein